MLPSCDRHGLRQTCISTIHCGSQGMRWSNKLTIHGKPISYSQCSTLMINICPSGEVQVHLHQVLKHVCLLDLSTILVLTVWWLLYGSHNCTIRVGRLRKYSHNCVA